VGSFAGAAISSPPVQLGMVALAVVAPQAAIVVGIRNRIDRRVRERVQSPRDTSDWRRAGEELEALRRGRAALPSPTQLRVLADLIEQGQAAADTTRNCGIMEQTHQALGFSS
jgi:hypothetical protein